MSDTETVDPQAKPAFQIDPGKPTFSMGLTPLGKIGLNITVDGNTVGYVVETPAEAWEIAGHLLSIATMMVQAYYAMAQKEQQDIARLMAETNQKVWTPK